MSEIHRTLKVQVTFPGWRKEDLDGKTGLWYQLKQAQGELTEACNRLITALFMVKQGSLKIPEIITTLHPEPRLG